MKTPDPTPPAVIRVTDSLDELAAAINGVYAVAEETTRQGLAHYREVGQMLLAAKEKCGHGNWLPWLKAHVRFSKSHAYRYMALAKLPTVGNLEEAWLTITGRDEPETEPEPEQLAPSGFVATDTAPPDEESGPVEPQETDWEPPPERDDGDDNEPPANDDAPGYESDLTPSGRGQPAHVPPPPPFAPPSARPKWMVPGNHADPDHPFADILNKLAAVAAALTKAMAADETGVLKETLLAVQRVKPANPLFVLNRELWVDGKKFGAQFVMLRPLRRLIRKAGEAIKKGQKAVKNPANEYQPEDES